MMQNLDRREIVRLVAALGLGNSTFHRAIAVEAERETVPPATITPEMVSQAEWVAGITLTDDQRQAVAVALTRTVRNIATGRQYPVANHVPPAVHFQPAPGKPPYFGPRGVVQLPPGDATMPRDDDDLAFLPVAKLSRLLRARKVTSLELTKFFLARLRKYDPALLCVVSLTDELALKQAQQADEELANGIWRGPLHGVPWVAKDLIAVPDYKTTWGAEHFKNQILPTKATVAKRLEDAGAVLIAKTTLGALAMGDRWFGGQTRNPWSRNRGSSGSSAGTASAVAAGLAPFGIGSETLGSIVSPSAECGVTGLRPTFGRISRHGCMTLSWTMDKLGPICRSAEDCALVFGAIHGADGIDATAVDRPFEWPVVLPWKQLRVGHLVGKTNPDGQAALQVFSDLGATIVPITLPTSVPVEAIQPVLTVEAAAAFEDLTRQGISHGIGNWATTFRQGRYVSAVDYLRANRLRTLLMREMATLMEGVDFYVDSSRSDLLITNLTGHPSVCVPSGFRKSDSGVERPKAIVFTGQLYDEARLLTVVQAYQVATGHHLRHPDLSQCMNDSTDSSVP